MFLLNITWEFELTTSKSPHLWSPGENGIVNFSNFTARIEGFWMEKVQNCHISEGWSWKQRLSNSGAWFTETKTRPYCSTIFISIKPRPHGRALSADYALSDKVQTLAELQDNVGYGVLGSQSAASRGSEVSGQCSTITMVAVFTKNISFICKTVNYSVLRTLHHIKINSISNHPPCQSEQKHICFYLNCQCTFQWVGYVPNHMRFQ